MNSTLVKKHCTYGRHFLYFASSEPANWKREKMSLSADSAEKSEIVFYRPQIEAKEDFQRNLDKVFTRRWFTNAGPMEQELSRKIADLHQVEHCVLFANATLALQ